MIRGAEEAKELVGRKAAERVEDGMVLGLGTGSTVRHFLRALGERIRSGSLTHVEGVPTSEWTRAVAVAEKIPLVDLREGVEVSLAVDGADEVAPNLDLLKGLGGALLREKIVAQAAGRFLVIADEGKLVRMLGETKPLPVEVVPFGWSAHLPYFRSLGAHPEIRTREDGQPFVTDNGNYVVDLRFEGGLPEPRGAEEALRDRSGVVTTGLFLGMAAEALVAGEDGVRELTRGEPASWH